MKKTLNIIAGLSTVILIYWIATKFIDINGNKFLGALYEMSALIFVALTILTPIFIVSMFVKNRKNAKGNNTIYEGLLFLFSLINIFIMTQHPF